MEDSGKCCLEFLQARKSSYSQLKMNINSILTSQVEKMKFQIVNTWVYGTGSGKLNPKSDYKVCTSSHFIQVLSLVL